MGKLNARGFSLVEALVALAILGMAAVAILPAFMTQAGANTRSEQRSAAVSALQQTMEGLRLDDPSTMPSSGSSAPQLVTVGSHEFEVRTHFCLRAEFCDARSRHVTVEVYLNNRKIYDAQTIYTQLL